MNSLVIGGAGFVGSHLVKALFDAGHRVVSYDNYFTGRRENHHAGVEYIEGESLHILEEEFSCKFDYIFHFGEYSRVEQSFADVDLAFRYNLQSLPEVLKLVRIHDAMLIYSGSSTKFGDGGENRFQSPYAWTKSTNTELINCFADWFGIRYAIVYFYNVYGENEISKGTYATVIAKFIELRKRGIKSLPVVSPGSQVRNFTHVNDIVRGVMLVAEGGSGDGYCIGCDEAYSILDVVDMMGARPHFLPERKGNRLGASLDSSRLSELGWRPQESLHNYINEALDGY